MAKRIYGVFDDEEILMNAIPALKSQGVVCMDVQSPFPIHGIESLIGVPRTRISITSFMFFNASDHIPACGCQTVISYAFGI